MCRYNKNVKLSSYSWAVGIIWGFFSWTNPNEKHCANFVITRERGIQLIEPQKIIINRPFYPIRNHVNNVELVVI